MRSSAPRIPAPSRRRPAVRRKSLSEQSHVSRGIECRDPMRALETRNLKLETMCEPLLHDDGKRTRLRHRSRRGSQHHGICSCGRSRKFMSRAAASTSAAPRNHDQRRKQHHSKQRGPASAPRRSDEEYPGQRQAAHQCGKIVASLLRTKISRLRSRRIHGNRRIYHRRRPLARGG